MRTIAELLFWIGRLETVIVVLIIAHIAVVWQWRKEAVKRWLAVGWLPFFIILLPTLFYELLFRPLTRGIGYTWGHLYEGIWTDEQALSNILLGWSNTLLPRYSLLLGIWAAGLIGISLLARIKWRLITYLR